MPISRTGSPGSRGSPMLAVIRDVGRRAPPVRLACELVPRPALGASSPLSPAALASQRSQTPDPRRMCVHRPTMVGAAHFRRTHRARAQVGRRISRCLTSTPPGPRRCPGPPGARRRNLGLLRLPAPRRVARGTGADQGRALPRRDVLGPARPGLRRPPDARILLVGLAPAAHGGNRTGRVFTGRCLGRLPVAGDPRGRPRGPAGQPPRRRRTDAQRGTCRGGGPLRAAGEQADTPRSEAACRPYLVREIELLAELRVVVALGAIGWDATLRAARRPRPRDAEPEAPRPRREATVGRTRSSARTTHRSRTRLRAGSTSPMLGRRSLRRAQELEAS